MPEKSRRNSKLINAIYLVCERQKASIGMLVRYLGVDFNYGANLMEQLELFGVVGPEVKTKPRRVLISLNDVDEFIKTIPEDVLNKDYSLRMEPRISALYQNVEQEYVNKKIYRAIEKQVGIVVDKIGFVDEDAFNLFRNKNYVIGDMSAEYKRLLAARIALASYPNKGNLFILDPLLSGETNDLIELNHCFSSLEGVDKIEVFLQCLSDSTKNINEFFKDAVMDENAVHTIILWESYMTINKQMIELLKPLLINRRDLCFIFMTSTKKENIKEIILKDLCEYLDYIRLNEILAKINPNWRSESFFEDNPQIMTHLFDNIKSGVEFEAYCARLLECNGFYNLKLTCKTGDHGADIIAERDDVRFVFQCKYYNGSVGNSAVQEVYSAKRYYDADIAVVITNSRFTPQAIEEAEKLHVKLWDSHKLNALISKNI